MDKRDKKNNPGSEVKSPEDKNSGRRKLLKSVVAGGGAATVAKMLPDQWARPVVDAVMLPSHAQTSNAAMGPFTGLVTGQITPSTMVADQGFSEELLEFFTPAAHAGFDMPNDLSLSANETGDSYLCASTNTTTEVTVVEIDYSSNPPSFPGSSETCLFGGTVQGGEFVGNGWEVTILPPGINVSTVVEFLAAGGSGCTAGETEGECPAPL